MPQVPVDRRPQFSMMDIVVANASLGRMPLAGAEQIGPDRYVLAGPQRQAAGLPPSILAAARVGK
jgi:hypothetical protein